MLHQKGALTLNEISTQGEIWKKTLQIIDQKQQEIISWFLKEGFNQLVFIGAGSSFNAAVVCSRFFLDLTGVSSSCFPSSELFYGLRLPFEERKKTLAVFFSRSGASSETIWAMQKLNKHPNVKNLLITPSTSGEACSYADKLLTLDFAAEESAVETRVYTASILAFKYLTSFLMKNMTLYNELRAIPDKFQFKKYQTETQRITAVKPTNILVIGNGMFYGHAKEGAALITKMAAIPSVTDYANQIRYGGAAHATQNTLTIIFASESMRKAEGFITGELAATKSHRLILCENADQRLGNSDFVVELKSGLSEQVRDLLMITVIQELAFYMSIQKAYNADKPKNVPACVTWKEPYFNK